MHRWVCIAERVLIGGQLTNGMEIVLTEKKQELSLRELRINLRDGDELKGGISRSKPRILPLVRYGENVTTVQVPPRGIALLRRLHLRRDSLWVGCRSLADIEVELLAPEQARVGLTCNGGFLARKTLRYFTRVELVSFRVTSLKYGIELSPRQDLCSLVCLGQAQTVNKRRLRLAHLKHESGLGASRFCAKSGVVPTYHVSIKRVFRRSVRH